MLILAFGVAALAHRYLQMYAPSNAIVARVRRARPRVRVAGGLLVLSAALAFVAAILTDVVASGGPGWLNLLVLIAAWDALKFGILAVRVPFVVFSSRCGRQVSTVTSNGRLRAREPVARTAASKRGLSDDWLQRVLKTSFIGHGRASEPVLDGEV